MAEVKPDAPATTVQVDTAPPVPQESAKDEPKPSLTEGTVVAAPASASVIPNDSPAKTGTTMGVSQAA